MPKSSATKETDIRQDVEFYVNILLDLHDRTDPAKGRISEEDKLSNARHAIEVWWRLHDRLMHWAQSQIVGYCLAKSDPKVLELLPRFDRNVITEDSHELEFLGQGYGWNPTRVPDAYAEKLEKLHEKMPGIDDPTLRTIIVELLISRSANSSFWRFELQDALRALNAGQPLDLIKPAGRRRQGGAFRLKQWKHSAISQVRFRLGRGLKKHRALEEVGSVLGQSPETLRGWEKMLIDDEDHEFDLWCAELAGRIGDEFESSRDEELAEKYGMNVHRGRTDLETARWLLPQLREESLQKIRDQIRKHRATR